MKRVSSGIGADWWNDSAVVFGAVSPAATTDIRLTPGKDHYSGTAGADSVRGLAGDDFLEGLRGDDRMFGDKGDDSLNGDQGSDKLHGNAGDDVLQGGQSRDLLFGGDGDDILYGDEGADSLNGGLGADRLDLGNGVNGDGAADRVVYKSVAESTQTSLDTVDNFFSGVDKIDLHAIDADINTPGNDAFTYIGTAAFSGTAGEVRTQHFDNSLFGDYVLADVDGDGQADLMIQVDFAHVLATDIVL